MLTSIVRYIPVHSRSSFSTPVTWWALMIRVLHDNNHLWHTQINQSTKHNAGLGIMITALSDVDLRCFLKGLKTSRGWRERKKGGGEESVRRSFNPDGAFLSWASRPQYCSWDGRSPGEHHQHREDKSRFWSEDESQVLTGHMLTGCEGCSLKWNLPNSEWGRVLSSSLDRAWLT